MLRVCVCLVVFRDNFSTMFYKRIMSHCAFGAITDSATRNDVIEFISAVIINAIKAVVNTMSRLKSIIVFELLSRWDATIITVLFGQMTKLFFGESEFTSSSIVGIEGIECSLSFWKFLKIIPVASTTFGMSCLKMNTISNGHISTLTQTLPHGGAPTVWRTLDDLKKSIFAPRQIYKSWMVGTGSETTTTSSVSCPKAYARCGLLIAALALTKPHNISTLLSETLYGSQPSVFNSSSIYKLGHERIIS